MSFDGQEVRPTSDKVRESLFNILQNRIYGCKFLDLFCGTGAMGIEALSRGAKSVSFNDKARDSVRLTKENLKRLKIDNGVEVTNFDALTFLKTNAEQFDIIYIDPPYKSTLGVDALNLVCARLAENGVVVFEDEKVFEGQAQGLVVYDRRKYGRVHLTFFKKGE